MILRNRTMLKNAILTTEILTTTKLTNTNLAGDTDEGNEEQTSWQCRAAKVWKKSKI
jgi:hypothetical protein